jgi:AraC-like DNA-binding protein
MPPRAPIRRDGATQAGTYGRDWTDGLPGMDPRRLELVLARLPARLRRARRVFRDLTGFTAVTSVRSAAPQLGDALPLWPPVHPQCVEQMRTVRDPPCHEQWDFHVCSSLRSRRSHSHTCPLGLRCSCVPIYLGDALVGVAKVVVDGGTSADAFSSATATLALAVSSVCQESYASVLWGELQALRQRVSGFRQVESPSARRAGAARQRTASPDGARGAVDNVTIVDRALDHIHHHFMERDLSLGVVAAALECNPNYLTHRFTQLVGQRMHGYVVALRVERACRELLGTDLPIKQIALESGFRDAAGLSRTFRRQVGVSPSEYRRIFAGR